MLVIQTSFQIYCTKTSASPNHWEHWQPGGCQQLLITQDIYSRSETGSMQPSSCVCYFSRFSEEKAAALQDSSDLLTWRRLILCPTAKGTIGASENCPFLKVRLKFALRLFNLREPCQGGTLIMTDAAVCVWRGQCVHGKWVTACLCVCVCVCPHTCECVFTAHVGKWSLSRLFNGHEPDLHTIKHTIKEKVIVLKLPYDNLWLDHLWSMTGVTCAMSLCHCRAPFFPQNIMVESCF